MFNPSLEEYHKLTEEDEVQYLRRKVKELERRQLEASWASNPDRMGGAFTQDEVEYAAGWH